VNDGVDIVVSDMCDAQLEAMAMDAEHLELLRSLRYRSALVLPLRARHTVIGALLLGTAAGGRRLAGRVVDVARRLAERAALAIDTARLYEAARQANRVKSEFLAVMSHELRTPLNAIGGYVELLELELRGPITAAQRRDLERIRVSRQHLLGLISAVLDLSRIESGRVSYELESIPLDAFLQSLDALIAPQVAASALTLAYDACPPSLGVRADREKLRQVVLNVLSNAVRYTPAGGRIRFGASADGPLVRIVVADTGIGIAPDALERIFEPFVKLDRSLTRGREGVGLGLAISRDLARGMGGDLTATSQPGVGSAFILTLPRVRLDGQTSWSATAEVEVVPSP
jgi:signal transduction histidine kinase